MLDGLEGASASAGSSRFVVHFLPRRLPDVGVRRRLFEEVGEHEHEGALRCAAMLLSGLLSGLRVGGGAFGGFE